MWYVRLLINIGLTGKLKRQRVRGQMVAQGCSVRLRVAFYTGRSWVRVQRLPVYSGYVRARDPGLAETSGGL